MNNKNAKLALLLVRFAAAGDMLIHRITRQNIAWHSQHPERYIQM